MISAHELVQSRDCTFAGCVSEAESGSDRCRRHAHAGAGAATIRESPFRPAAPSKREVARQKTAEDRGASATRGPWREWPRDSIVAALLLFRDRNGRWPSAAEWQLSEERRGAEYPNYDRVAACFGGFRAALAAATATLPAEPAATPEPPKPEPAPATSLRDELRRIADALDRVAAAAETLAAR